MDTIELRPIGFARTGRADPADAPTQAGANVGETGELELLPEYVEGLRGLEGFDYAWLISWFDRLAGEPPRLEDVPNPLRHTGRAFGVFATRSPARPNHLGLSLVRILGVDGARVRFAGVDLADRTPVLDIKPFAPGVDVPADAATVRTGWMEQLR